MQARLDYRAARKWATVHCTVDSLAWSGALEQLLSEATHCTGGSQANVTAGFPGSMLESETSNAQLQCRPEGVTVSFLWYT